MVSPAAFPTWTNTMFRSILSLAAVLLGGKWDKDWMNRSWGEDDSTACQRRSNREKKNTMQKAAAYRCCNAVQYFRFLLSHSMLYDIRARLFGLHPSSFSMIIIYGIDSREATDPLLHAALTPYNQGEIILYRYWYSTRYGTVPCTVPPCLYSNFISPTDNRQSRCFDLPLRKPKRAHGIISFIKFYLSDFSWRDAP